MPDQYWKQPDSIDLKLNSLPLSDKLMAVFYDREIYADMYAVSVSVFVCVCFIQSDCRSVSCDLMSV